MKYINKNDIKSGIVIVIASVTIALLYNVIRSDECSGKIPFFKPSKENLIVSDDELFGNSNMPNNTELQIKDTTYIDTTTNVDTIIPTADTPNVDKVDYETLPPNETKKTSSADYSIITKEQMEKIAADNSNNFIIIDARNPEEYKKAHIGNAINIFPYDDESIVFEKIQTLSISKIIIVYCDGGDCDSSHMLGKMLDLFGYKFFIYEGGWEEWDK